MSEALKENTPKVEKTAKAQKLVGVKGMNDILPPDSARWEWLETQVRGLMARYAAQKNIRDPRKLKKFDLDGYAYVASDSTENHWIFRRRIGATQSN